MIVGDGVIATASLKPTGEVMEDSEQRWWGMDHALIWSVAAWAVDMGELNTAQEVLSFWEKPWKYPELHNAWELEQTSP
jgi:hypothetical protein